MIKSCKILLPVFIVGMLTAGPMLAQSINLTGVVKDNDSGLPIEFATISVFDLDNQLVAGGVSELGGAFNISSPETVSYAVIEYLSFEAKRLEIDPSSGNFDYGTVFLLPASHIMDEIEILGEKSTSQYLLDKKVFNVGKDLATRGGSALEVLDNVPSLSVDVEGNLALRGSQNVRVLINGRPSGLLGISGNGGLRNLQASQIERIEVITNPSARYEAEGAAGIINIVLRQDRTNGFNGSFTANLGWPTQYGGGANVNYRKGLVNFFANYGVNRAIRPGSGYSYTEFYGQDTALATKVNRVMDRKGLNQSIRTGFDIFLPADQVLTASFGYTFEDNDNVTDIRYRDYSFVGIPPNRDLVENLNDYELRLDNEIEKENKLEYTLNYKKDFSGEDHNLQASIQYENNGEDEDSDFRNTNYINGIEAAETLIQRSANSEEEKKFLGKIDYIRAFSKKSKVEAGFQTSLRDINNNYLVETLTDGVWANEVNLSNEFEYAEDVQAAYAQFGNKINDWSFQLGLRGEFSDISTFLVTSGEGYDTTYLNFFPSGFLSYAVSERTQMQASYSRRINRPRFRELNPFFTFSDNRNFFSGNPFLRPEYIDSYEIGILQYFENGSFTSSLYHRKTHDKISRIKTVNADDGTSRTAPQNLGQYDATGLEILYSFDPFKWLKINAEANIFHFKYYGNELPMEYRVNSLAYTARLNTRLALSNGLDVQVRANYRGAEDGPQGRRRSITTVDLGLSKDFLKNNLTVTFSARDIFNQRRWNYERRDVDFYEEGEFQWMRNSYTLSLNYRINAKKERQRGGGDFEGGGGMEF